MDNLQTYNSKDVRLIAALHNSNTPTLPKYFAMQYRL
jgi:hypothetical protein